MTEPKGRFVWYELMTSDADAARTFYGSVVGWTFQSAPTPDMDYTLLTAPDGAQIGGLMPFPPHLADGGAPPHWAPYIAVADTDAFAGQAVKLGGQLCFGPQDIPGVGRFAVIADPLGAMFVLFTPQQPGDSQAFAMGNPGHAGWNELNSSDWPKAFDFYHALFGWTKGEAFEMGPMGVYQLFATGGDPVGGMLNSPVADKARFWLTYFCVDDIDAAEQRVTAAGGAVLHGPTQAPGGAWILQATDPQGAVFALVGSRTS